MASIMMILPIYYQDHNVLKTLKSLLKLEVPKGTDIDLFFGVNGSTNRLNFIINKYVERLLEAGAFRTIKVINFGKNIGKGDAINKIYKENKNSYDFLLSADSDINYPNSDFLSVMIEAFYKAGPFGAIAAEQMGACCHYKENYIKTNILGYTLRVYERNEGVAGGVLLIPVDVWERVGGYKTVANSVYGGDDAFFMRDCSMLSLKVPVLENSKVYHPYSSNREYADWKKRSCIGSLEPEEQGGFIF